MPNVEAAVALLESSTESAPSEPAPDAGGLAPPGDVPESEVGSGGEDKPEPKDATKLDAEERKARLQLLNERIAKVAADRKAKEAAAAQREWEEERKAHRENLGKDPKATLKALGFSPLEAYDAITNAVVEDDKPENRLKAELSKEFEPTKRELEELKAKFAEQERQAAVAHRAQQEAGFLNIVSGDSYELLRDEFSDDNGTVDQAALIAAADEMATRIAHELDGSGKRFTLQDIADRLLRERSSAFERYKAIEARRQKREAAKKSALGQTSEAAKTSNGLRVHKTGTVTNQLASATASGEGTLSKEQRLARAAAALKL